MPLLLHELGGAHVSGHSRHGNVLRGTHVCIVTGQGREAQRVSDGEGGRRIATVWRRPSQRSARVLCLSVGWAGFSLSLDHTVNNKDVLIRCCWEMIGSTSRHCRGPLHSIVLLLLFSAMSFAEYSVSICVPPISAVPYLCFLPGYCGGRGLYGSLELTP